ncbi:tyrosine--tRNA ligase [Thioalkalivibrio sp. HK1]|uniref:tyrosine--tRNA ligase n=1 Tax=Thioalkalivibrio sp. HK1 TaxID=1469245 RepID=UPI0009DEF5FA|nr:tyrosine--tRNA ligase [Thioalkalivibrio sp. HK1]
MDTKSPPFESPPETAGSKPSVNPDFSPRSDFLRIAIERGYLHQCTDLEGLDAKAADDAPIAGYIGFDATADSLHVGSLVQIMLLRLMQRTGHRPIVLMGGGTTRIGDPSGKDESRQLLSAERIASNIKGIHRVFARFLEFDDPVEGDAPPGGPLKYAALGLDNADWLNALGYIDFLREYGMHFSVNRMLGFESVRRRLDREQPLSFLEFNYMVLQAYDFVELARRHACRLQIGGSDQWGNIVCGVELGRKAAKTELFGLTSPLLTTAGGAKMGKTAAGAIWLNPDRCSPYEYWQYWRNCDDADVGRFLRLFTELPLGEIARLESLAGAEINEAKAILATETTTLCHGRKAAIEAAETARRTFAAGGENQAAMGEALPTVEVPRARLQAGIPIADLMCEAGLTRTKSEARRLIIGGGARVNDIPVAEETMRLDASHLNEEQAIKLSAGRKRHALVRAKDPSSGA